jgi:hypothetical protein
MNSYPPHYINDPGHWLKRAAEARAMADQLSDLQAKAAMLRIAEDYERLAERAKARASGRAPKSK